MAESAALTTVLRRMERGETKAIKDLFPLVYQDLRRRAAQCLAQERVDHTLQATALVNEVFLKMAGGQEVEWESRLHFYNAAADAMRRILVDHARAKGAAKRGKRGERVDLKEILAAEIRDDVDFEALDGALVKLQAIDARRHQVVMYRYFSGLTEVQIAGLLKVTIKTVQRDWRTAKMFLLAEIGEANGRDDTP